MDFGVSFANSADRWKIARRAEELGFSHAWFSDTQLLNADPFVAMAAAAMKTSSIRLGTAVLVPTNRLAPVTANALASLNHLAPGRIDLGISTGFTARRAMGLGAITLAELEDYIGVLRGLLSRETVEWDHEGRRRKIRFLNPELGLINTTDPIPIHVSAFGPRGRRLTARLGANWMVSMSNVERAVAGLAAMHEAWREAGRDPADYYSTAITGGCVLDEGEPYDSPRARREAGPVAALVVHKMVEDEAFGPVPVDTPPFIRPLLDEYRALYQAYEPADARYLTVHRGHLLFLREDEAPLITGDLIRATTFTGTRHELREKIRELKRAGYSQFSAHIRHGSDESLERWADVVEGV